MHAATWMRLENIVQSERSQSQKTMYYMILFIQNGQNRQICIERKQVNGCLKYEGRKLVEEIRECTSNRCKVWGEGDYNGFLVPILLHSMSFLKRETPISLVVSYSPLPFCYHMIQIQVLPITL